MSRGCYNDVTVAYGARTYTTIACAEVDLVAKNTYNTVCAEIDLMAQKWPQDNAKNSF
jgi:hypothetical protein